MTNNVISDGKTLECIGVTKTDWHPGELGQGTVYDMNQATSQPFSGMKPTKLFTKS